MNKNLLLLPIFLLVLYFVWPTREVPPTEKPVTQTDYTEEIVTKKTPPKRPTSKQQHNTVNPKSSAKVPIQNLKPKPQGPLQQVRAVDKPIRQLKVSPGHVIFEIKMKDWAVSFGDVLLGKLKSGQNIKIGQYKPPKPFLWPTADIPYVIDSSYKNPERVMEVIDYFNQNTPIHFVARTNEEDGIVFTQGEEHCYSYLGKMGNFQPIFLSEACFFPQILHEVMHALGFVHEQSRTDRENFLEVLWDNIDPKFHLQFLMVPDELMIASQTGGFDFKSVMIYNEKAFALDGKTSLQSKTRDAIAPTADGLSEGDLEKLDYVYGN